MKSRNIFAIIIFLLAAILISGCNAAPDTAVVKNGDTVQVNYTGALANGTVFDTSAGREPLEFTVGKGEVVPGFEKAVLGMKVGEKKTVTIPADEAYGPYHKEKVLEVPRELIPSNITPQVGQQLKQKQDDGSYIIAVITKVSDKTVTVDANLPLAGKDLTFQIELVKIIKTT